MIDFLAAIFPNDPVLHYIGVGMILFFSVGFSYWILNWFGLQIIEKVISRSKNRFDDALLKRGFFKAIINILPLTILHMTSNLFPEYKTPIQKTIELGYYVFGTWGVHSALSAGNDIYLTYPVSRDRPIKGYIQIVQIIILIIGVILIVSHLMGKSPFVLISALGAIAAVLMLVFKDTILSLVASVKIYGEGTLKVGDWIEMPKFEVDGDVIDISLYTVRIQNWDKTIVSVPTFRFSEESFKNWRGMKESGGRRIKRSLLIDMNSIRIADQELLTKLKLDPLLKTYITEKQKEIDEFNNNFSESNSLSRRNFTNIGLFRKFLENFLIANQEINKNMTFLIRQLEPTERGLPIQIYIFTSNTNWVPHEGIQSDIFDSIISKISLFDLRIFQLPSGLDFQRINSLKG
ncbi:MAG: mechanosensitive ion channel [Leptospiraceae bacterium]|nr:mechanosensitive ion channel [Leptospiraceae bacterium]